MTLSLSVSRKHLLSSDCSVLCVAWLAHVMLSMKQRALATVYDSLAMDMQVRVWPAEG